MSDRRNLIDGLHATPDVDPAVERAFIHGKPIPTRSGEAASYAAPPPVTLTRTLNRVSYSTKLRKDYVDALKRASLERQLSGVEPSTIVDMLEQAIEPWLRANGYLP
jgi:hypothetical protein